MIKKSGLRACLGCRIMVRRSPVRNRAPETLIGTMAECGIIGGVRTESVSQAYIWFFKLKSQVGTWRTFGQESDVSLTVHTMSCCTTWVWTIQLRNRELKIFYPIWTTVEIILQLIRMASRHRHITSISCRFRIKILRTTTTTIETELRMITPVLFIRHLAIGFELPRP